MGVRGWLPTLPRPAWVLLAGDALSALGSGLTLPFLVIYLHEVRGIDLSLAGAAASTIALAGFAGNPLGGSLADRFGARSAVALGLLVAGAGAWSLALVEHAWQAFPAAALSGLGVAMVWPAQDALLATLVSPEQRPDVFSVRHATLNAGFALGGLVAAAVVSDESVSQFVVLYLVDGATFLAFIPILLTLPNPKPRRDGGDASTAAPAAGYRTVLRDAAFRRVWILTAALVAVGYAQLNSTFPAFAARDGGVSPGAVGLAFAANTAGVVLLQLVTLRLLRGRRRTSALAFTALFWAGAWLLTAVAGGAGGHGGAVALFAAAALVFALGETCMSPSVAPIVNDLASDELRGRYNGLFTMAWTTGFAIGPVAGSMALDAGSGSGVFIVLAGLCAGLAWAGHGLHAKLPAAIDVVAEAG